MLVMKTVDLECKGRCLVLETRAVLCEQKEEEEVYEVLSGDGIHRS